MSEKKISIAEELLTVDTLSEQIDVVLNDLQDAYFTDDMYKPCGGRAEREYDRANTRVCILVSLINEMQETIANMRQNMNE